MRVSPDVAPWSAIVRVQIPGMSRCTGFAVASTIVITAAHCLYGRALHGMVPAQSIHVLSGYQGGDFLRHAVVTRYRMAAGFGMGPGSDAGTDVAALMLPYPVTRTVLALAPAHWGEAAMLGGYNQDRAEALLADTRCSVLGLLLHPPGLPLRRHDCSGTHGASGAPLLVRDGVGRWVAAGVEAQGNLAGAGGLAVPSETVQHLLDDVR